MSPHVGNRLDCETLRSGDDHPERLGLSKAVRPSLCVQLSPPRLDPLVFGPHSLTTQWSVGTPPLQPYGTTPGTWTAYTYLGTSHLRYWNESAELPIISNPRERVQSDESKVGYRIHLESRWSLPIYGYRRWITKSAGGSRKPHEGRGSEREEDGCEFQLPIGYVQNLRVLGVKVGPKHCKTPSPDRKIFSQSLFTSFPIKNLCSCPTTQCTAKTVPPPKLERDPDLLSGTPVFPCDLSDDRRSWNAPGATVNPDNNVA